MRFIVEVAVLAPMYVSLFWAVLFLSESKPRILARYLLGFFMVGATLVYLSHAVYFSNDAWMYLVFDPIYVLASLSVYPLFYWYVKLLTEETTWNFKNIWHLTPAILLSAGTALVYLFMSYPELYVLDNMFNRANVSVDSHCLWRTQRILYLVIRAIFAVQIIAYLFYGYRKIRKYEMLVEDFYSNLEGRRVDWTKWLLVIFSATAIVSAIANLMGRSYFAEKQGLVILPALVFGVLIFLIGFWGSKQFHTIRDLRFDEYREGSSLVETELLNQTSDENDSLNPAFSVLRKQLIALFEMDRIYANPDLKISQVSQCLNTNRTYVSKLINEEFGCSFSDFVSKYRVAEAKNILRNSNSADLTLEQVAERSGFSSAAALIRIFKQFEGVTPGRYRRKMSL